jgi:hypothetical protein
MSAELNRSEVGLHVGCRNFEMNDPVQGARIPVRLLYPTRSDEHTERFGPYEVSVAMVRVVTKIDAPRIKIIDGPSVEAVGPQGSAPARQEGSPLPPSPSHRPVG